MYVFFDIDNTLISHKGISHVPPQTRTAIELLRQAGHIPAIATGRGGFLTFTTARDFGITHIVCSGGAQIFADGQEIHRAMFPPEHLDAFREVAAKFPSLTAAIDDKYLYATDAFSPFFNYFNAQAGYDCIRPLSSLKSAIICYIMLPPETLTPMHGIFFSPPGNITLELMHAFTEARCAGSSKWNGIERLIAHEKASLDEVIVFGDGPNDVEMIARAKIGVAVGNASECAKNAADYVCGDIDDGGILEACRHLGLI
ncbi:MAG: HAD hydrolase family protein [Synergistaceae bacterium]|nr:HAD hydrolase family protein [Synergistaceae bacterium]